MTRLLHFIGLRERKYYFPQLKCAINSWTTFLYEETVEILLLLVKILHSLQIYWKGNTVAVLSFDKHQNDFKLKNSFSVETEIKDVIYTKFHLDEKSSGKC